MKTERDSLTTNKKTKLKKCVQLFEVKMDVMFDKSCMCDKKCKLHSVNNLVDKTIKLDIGKIMRFVRWAFYVAKHMSS